jgi:bifunctional UDP-N-acetylglucosamine pyrophosphorylase/glucosamine-1-phosphate N-acetyltransferase
MKSSVTKVLHPLAGRPMIEHILAAVDPLHPVLTVIVAGRNRQSIRDALHSPGIHLVRQEEPLGTAHALLTARGELDGFNGDIVVLCGDTPLIRPDTLHRLLQFHRGGRGDATLLTCRFSDPGGYGRIIRGGDGAIRRIVEEVDTSPEEKAIREVNTGVYCFRAPVIFKYLEGICGRDKRPGEEYFLTDIVDEYNRADLRVGGLLIDEEMEVLGINTLVQLASADRILRERIRDHWMTEGVTLMDPPSTFIDARVVIGADTRIYPFVVIEGDSVIGENTVIGPFSRIINSRLEPATRLMGWNFVENASIPEGQVLPPFSSYPRGGSDNPSSP